MALARFAALRQQAARAQTGLAALSASAALSLGQHSLYQPYEGPWLQAAGSSTAWFQHQCSHTSASPAAQALRNTASQPPFAHGYVASAQPDPIEEDHEVCLACTFMLAGICSASSLHDSIANAYAVRFCILRQ